MQKHVLYLSYDGMTDPLGQSQVLPYLSGLSAKGYKIHLISFEKPVRYKTHQPVIQQICDQSEITWHPLIYTKKPPLLSTLYDVWRMKRLALKLHKKYTFSLVHCRSYIAALVGIYLKKHEQVKFLFDMRGFWADERVDGKIWNLENPVFKRVYHFFKQKEIQFFKEADAVVSLTFNGKNEIESWPEFNQHAPDITVIPCCVDLNLFDPKHLQNNQLTELKKQIAIRENQFVLGYVGSIGTWYMLPEMLDYFKVLLEKKPDSLFLFVTGENPETIMTVASQKGISPDQLRIVSCLHREVPSYISLFDAGIFFIRPTFSKKASSPTKQGEIMAMGIPVICNAGVGDTDKVINDYAAGIVLNALTEQAYRESLPFLETFSAKDSIRGAHEFYGLETGTKRYGEIYEKILRY